MNQTERIKQYIEEFGSITQKEAVSEIGCYRLSARIADLKAEGYEIETEFVTSKNRYGDKVTFAKYKFKGDDEDEDKEPKVLCDSRGVYRLDLDGMGDIPSSRVGAVFSDL